MSDDITIFVIFLFIFGFMSLPSLISITSSYPRSLIKTLKKFNKKGIKIYKKINNDQNDFFVIKDVWVYNEKPEDDYVIFYDILDYKKEDNYIKRDKLVEIDIKEEIDKLELEIAQRKIEQQKQEEKNLLEVAKREAIINDRKSKGMIF